uniref:Protein cornichon homolog 1 n=1 Tax=Araucaria cunninghamii TaxID=56994 RepID=A0A0D6R4P6_ARACU
MAWEVLLWLLAFFVVVGLLCIQVYQLMCLSDLEFDFINPYDSSARINRLVIPEFGIQGGLCLLFLLTGHWFMFLISAPLVFYHFQLYKSGKHLLDVTEIFNLLNGEKKYRMIKIGYYLILFFIVIFRMLLAVFEEEDYE